MRVGQAQQFIRLREQHVIHAPRIHADRDNLIAKSVPRDRQPALDFRPKPQHIPAQRARDFHAAIREAMQLLKPHGAAIPNACHDAAAFCAEVNTEVDLLIRAHER